MATEEPGPEPAGGEMKELERMDGASAILDNTLKYMQVNFNDASLRQYVLDTEGAYMKAVEIMREGGLDDANLPFGGQTPTQHLTDLDVIQKTLARWDVHRKGLHNRYESRRRAAAAQQNPNDDAVAVQIAGLAAPEREAQMAQKPGTAADDAAKARKAATEAAPSPKAMLQIGALAAKAGLLEKPEPPSPPPEDVTLPSIFFPMRSYQAQREAAVEQGLGYWRWDKASNALHWVSGPKDTGMAERRTNLVGDFYGSDSRHPFYKHKKMLAERPGAGVSISSPNKYASGEFVPSIERKYMFGNWKGQFAKKYPDLHEEHVNLGGKITKAEKQPGTTAFHIGVPGAKKGWVPGPSVPRKYLGGPGAPAYEAYLKELYERPNKTSPHQTKYYPYEERMRRKKSVKKLTR